MANILVECLKVDGVGDLGFKAHTRTNLFCDYKASVEAVQQHLGGLLPYYNLSPPWGIPLEH